MCGDPSGPAINSGITGTDIHTQDHREDHRDKCSSRTKKITGSGSPGTPPTPVRPPPCCRRRGPKYLATHLLIGFGVVV